MPGLKDELAEDLNTFMSSNHPEDEELPYSINVLNIIRTLIQRKDELYPDDDRVVVDFNIKETANERHLSVSSAMPGTHGKSFLA